MARSLPILILALALGPLGCPTDEPEPPALWAIQVHVNQAVPTVLNVRWKSAEPGTSFVEYGLDELDLTTPTTTGAATDHDVRVLGLKAARTYQLRPVTLLEGGERVEGAVQSVTLDPPPSRLPSLLLSDADEARMQPGGYVLTSYLQPDNSWVVILDRDGDYVWFHQAAKGLSIPTSTPGRDGDSILYTQNDRYQTVDISGTVRVSLDGEIVSITRNLMGHHDFAELPDGSIAWISLELRDVTIDKEDFTVAGDVIMESPEGADEGFEPLTIFNFFDDYYDPWIPCIHFMEEAYGTGGKDWSHCNSLMYDESDDTYLVMCRNFDNLIKIDRSNGQIIWEIGGPHATVQGLGPDYWSHGHMSHFWGDGFLVFDNGYHHEPAHSRVVEYAFDADAGIVEQVWEYWDPMGRFIPLLGDARRLPNGNTLTSWTQAGMLVELTPEGDEVWRIEADVGTMMGRVSYLEELYVQP